ncbi:MAG: DUF1566 domain-containing protein [Deltaproteobacteria bacterium]|nr:DUF1566 domain-containing protein [Deltaproteobacteria bacterium]
MATWTDPETDLEWQMESPGEMTWDGAMAYAGELIWEGRQDWRLPGVFELETLLDRSRYRPVIRPEVPFQDILSYWSSTTFGPATKNAWIVMFDGAYVLSYSKGNIYQVRCVRGPDQ